MPKNDELVWVNVDGEWEQHVGVRCPATHTNPDDVEVRCEQEAGHVGPSHWVNGAASWGDEALRMPAGW